MYFILLDSLFYLFPLSNPFLSLLLRRENSHTPLFMRAFKSKRDSFGGWQIVGNEVELMAGQRLSSLTEINEALCSSCALKPEKFQVWQENMMASMRKRGCCPYLPYKVFSGPQGGEVDISSTLPAYINCSLRDWRGKIQQTL